MRDYLVYLSGPITGLDYEGCTDWREYATEAFPGHIQGVSPMRAKRYLQSTGPISAHYGAYADLPLTRGRGLNARNRFDIRRADALLVNLLGATRVSIGSVMEVALANELKVPVIAAIEPDDLNLHASSMLLDCVDFLYHSLDEAIEGVVAVVTPHEKLMHNRLSSVRLLREEKRFDSQSPPSAGV